MNIKKNIDNQGDISCSSLPAGLGGNGEFERKLRKFKEIWEEIIQNGVSLRGSPTIKVALGGDHLDVIPGTHDLDGKYVYCDGVDDKPNTKDHWRNIVMTLTTNLTLMTMTKEKYIYCGDIKSWWWRQTWHS